MIDTLHENVVRKALFPVYELLRGRSTLAVLSSLERSQWYDADTMASLRRIKLRTLLDRARTRCPFYRERLGDTGCRDVGDLSNLPFLTRQDIQLHLQGLVATDVDPKTVLKVATGGSTGHPVHLYLDRNRAAYDIAAKIRARRWWGVDVGAKEAIFWGSPIEMSASNKWVKWKDRALNATFFSAFQMTSEDMRRYHEHLRELRPAVVFGYASTLHQFSEFLAADGLSISNVGIKVVITTAELLYDFMRESIESAFGCPVANEYGARDAGYIAHQCPEGNMHITAESVILECVDDDGRSLPAGEEGELVLTHLDNLAMPLIRYRLGDRGTLSDEACPCGRGLPLLKVMGGRTHDVIRKTDGSPIHPLFLIYVIRPMEGVRQFRIIQKSTTHMKVLLVVDERFDVKNEGYIVDKYKEFMGADMAVEVEKVNEIPLTVSGKHRWIVSEVSGETES